MAKTKINKLTAEEELQLKANENKLRQELIADIQKMGKLENQKIRRSMATIKPPKSNTPKAMEKYHKKVTNRKNFNNALIMNNLRIGSSIPSDEAIIDNDGFFKYGKKLLNQMTTDELLMYQNALEGNKNSQFLKNETNYSKNRVSYTYGTKNTENMRNYIAEQIGDEFINLPFEEQQKIVEQALINQKIAEANNSYVEGDTNSSTKIKDIWASYLDNSGMKSESMEIGANKAISNFRAGRSRN